MVVVSRWKSVRVSAEPEEEDNPGRDLVNEMREELHKRNVKQVKEEDDNS